MNISMKMRLLRFLGGAIMMMAAIPDAHATPAPIVACSSLTDVYQPHHPKGRYHVGCAYRGYPESARALSCQWQDQRASRCGWTNLRH